VRTLLAHPVRAVAAALLLVVLSAPHGAAVTVPSPIGKLSDYGSVFDRHGKDEVNAAIADIATLLKIDVYILVSWENPLPTVDQLAEAVFSAWGLSSRRAILAVFLRTGQDWTVSAVASASARTELGAIGPRLEQRMADLVAHDRIEEAVRAMFDELRSLPAAQKASAALAAQRRSSGQRGLPAALLVAVPVVLVVILAGLIRWRVCPRCARILRAERSRFGSGKRVYSCRRCGYRRGG